MAFFNFIQNNSNGVYLAGPRMVIIEADSPQEANQLVLAASDVYFGYRPGDCPSCCGDRWSPLADHEEGDKEPTRWKGWSYSVHYKPRSLGYGIPFAVKEI